MDLNIGNNDSNCDAHSANNNTALGWSVGQPDRMVERREKARAIENQLKT